MICYMEYPSPPWFYCDKSSSKTPHAQQTAIQKESLFSPLVIESISVELFLKVQIRKKKKNKPVTWKRIQWFDMFRLICDSKMTWGNKCNPAFYCYIEPKEKRPWRSNTDIIFFGLNKFFFISSTKALKGL